MCPGVLTPSARDCPPGRPAAARTILATVFRSSRLCAARRAAWDVLRDPDVPWKASGIIHIDPADPARLIVYAVREGKPPPRK